MQRCFLFAEYQKLSHRRNFSPHHSLLFPLMVSLMHSLKCSFWVVFGWCLTWCFVVFPAPTHTFLPLARQADAHLFPTANSTPHTTYLSLAQINGHTSASQKLAQGTN